MIEIDFERFHSQDHAEEGYDLYVMKFGNFHNWLIFKFP